MKVKDMEMEEKHQVCYHISNTVILLNQNVELLIKEVFRLLSSEDIMIEAIYLLK